MGVNKRHEAARVKNIGEAHLPCVLLLDVSGSMCPSIAELNEGVQTMIDTLREDANASGKVEICVITFNSNVDVYPFVPVDEFNPAQYTAGGGTSMNEAIIEALNQIALRRESYKQLGTIAYTPWVFLLTDGYAGDNSKKASALAALQSKLMGSKKKINFFPMGIGNDVNYSELKEYANDGVVLKATRDNFANAFVWLSDSLSSVSQTEPGNINSISAPKDIIVF